MSGTPGRPLWGTVAPEERRRIPELGRSEGSSGGCPHEKAASGGRGGMMEGRDGQQGEGVRGAKRLRREGETPNKGGGGRGSNLSIN